MLLSEDKITEIYCLADASSISTLNSSAGRIQAAPDHQREGRNPLLHVHSCRHRRPRAAEVHGLRQGDLREAGRRQGLHIEKVVIEDGLTIEGKPLHDVYEAVGHAKAYDFLYEISHDAPLTEETILTIHRLFYQQIDVERAGAYRKVPVFISGSQYAVAPVCEISKRVQQLVRWYI